MVAPNRPSFFYQLIQNAAKALFETCYQIEVYGLENIPRQGGFLIASNHISNLDPPFIGISLRRPLYYLGRQSLLHKSFINWFYQAIGMVPVDRESGSDVKALKKIFHFLQQNYGFVIFPEGTRSSDGELKKPEPGIGLIAYRSEVPVLPARVFGTFDAYNRESKHFNLRPELSIVFGEPMHFRMDQLESRPGREDYIKASEKIMHAISDLSLPAPVLY